MGKQALDKEWAKILRATTKYKRANIDKYTQAYIVDLNTVIVEVTKALTSLLPPDVSIPSSVRKLCSDYCRQIFIRARVLERTGRSQKIRYTVSGTTTNFIIKATSIEGVKDKQKIFNEIRDLRTQKTSRVLASSFNQIQGLKDMNADKSPLGLLRYNILKDVFNMNIDEIDLSQDSKILDVILGARYKQGSTRHGGLLHLGHLEGFAVVEKRAYNIIQQVTKRTEISIGTGFLEKYLEARAKTGKTLGFFGMDLEVDLTALSDEFNIDNISKVVENELIPLLKKEFYSKGVEWADTRGSSTPREKAGESLEIEVADIITAAFSKKKNKRTKFTPPAKRNPKKEKSRSNPLDLKLKVTERIETVKDSIPGSRKGNVPKKGRTLSKDTPKVDTTKDWLSLLPLINARLTPRVIANMRFPSLVNRTGNFANSASVINVEQTREGFPSFIYNYERNPYNVFDRTIGRSPWNTPERDPSTLVDKSLREVVREMAIGRFYTRRA